MKYKILFPVLMSAVIFNACSKDDAKTDLPGDKILETYYPGNSMEIKELAIYTKDGVIRDQAFIQNFIDRNVNANAKGYYYVGVSTVPVPQSSQALHFLNDNRVNYNGINMQITGYRDSLMLVAEYTSTPIQAAASSCAALLAKVPQYNAFTDCPDASCTSYRKTSPLIISGAGYYVPLLTYSVVTNECVSTPIEIPSINVVNSELISMLNTGDSVLIQYAKLPLVQTGKN
jgi:hypothetical protein